MPDRPRSELSGRQLVALALLASGGPIGIDLYLPALPSIAHDLNASTGSTQLTLYSFLLGFSGGQLVTGVLSDRFGRRRLLLFGSLAFAILAAVCTVVPSVMILVVARFFHGVAGAIGAAVSRAYVQDVAGRSAATSVFSFLAMVSGIVPVLAPVLGGAILRIGPWPVIFWAVAGLGVVTFVLSWMVLPEPALHNANDAPRPTRGLQTLLSDGVFRVSLAAIAAVSGVLFLVLAQTPFLLQETFGLSATHYALSFAAWSLGAVACSTVSRRLSGVVQPATIIVAGLVLSMLSSCLLVLALSLPLPFLFVELAFAGCIAPLGLVLPNATAVALSRRPALAGTASGILGVVQFGSSLVLVPLAFLPHPSPLVAACVMLGLSAAGCGAHVRYMRESVLTQRS
ncbi:Bcr/CflA family efflux MFS transporter [Modestobacter sp. VKM Ac-2979]|uniref:Bcr/CflA family efflux MFS transporter n=1 Tax=unclassified Modestobacter TaxID=2643866 RepID=UPI0022AB8603|nr:MULTISPECIES: Bcr/CflA family efflux MFS transporter [unclassified Modestobacter]MCZ2811981.1 Bcr/CflA family efflux MFS transporter [Modestobacter sp. VKM Ac-2979]MCZ2843705.1 Bcr/CflA family efflux MFS transporter [Modestobacter sp. VKM Ac-2980]